MNRKNHISSAVYILTIVILLGGFSAGGQPAAEAAAAIAAPQAPATTIGGVNLGNLTNYLFFFADARTDANWQGATKGFVGDVAVDGIQADERTSGGVPYAGTIYTNDSTLSAWQDIVDQNAGQAFASVGQTTRIAGLEADPEQCVYANQRAHCDSRIRQCCLHFPGRPEYPE